jgi:hypothetical protein
VDRLRHDERAPITARCDCRQVARLIGRLDRRWGAFSYQSVALVHDFLGRELTAEEGS